MLIKPQPPRIHPPKAWQTCVKSAALHAIALVDYAIVYARAWAADSIHARVRLAAENDRLHEECALLREELRIKDTRMAQISPQRRPHYGPHETILETTEKAYATFVKNERFKRTIDLLDKPVLPKLMIVT